MSEKDPEDVAWRDQLAAATAEQTQLTDRRYKLARAAGYFTGPRVKTRGNDVLPDWMYGGHADVFEAWAFGRGRTCMHNPNFIHPQPVWACVWRPGLVVCTDCLYLFEAATMAEDRTCDGCGRVVGGPENGDPIYALVAQVDFMSFRGGACVDCFPDGPKRYPEYE
jgi:hypothetical protein